MTTFQTKVSLGDLIAAAFDTAERYSDDPQRSSELAVAAVMHLLLGGEAGRSSDLRSRLVGDGRLRAVPKN
jgi:hypothetical protein